MIRPLGKNVHVEPVAESQESASGLYIPANERGPKRGKLLAVGPEAKDVEASQTVLYDRRAPVVDAGDGTVLVSIEHVLAVLG